MKLLYKILVGIGFIIFGWGALFIDRKEELNVAPSPLTTPPVEEIVQEPESERIRITEEVAGVRSVVEGTREVATVKRVIDGDTVELGDGRRLRYIGIDTPETVHPTRDIECLGPEASQKNVELVEGKQVQLERDVSNTDRLGRLLRYVYVDGVMVNEVLVREGFAQSSAYPPDIKHQALLDEAELSARQNRWGLWSHVCATREPADSLKASPLVIANLQSQVSEQETSSSDSEPETSLCTVKGNINAENEKIYHVSGCGNYAQTKIDSDKGERYFCTEEEAQAAGWRKAENC